MRILVSCTPDFAARLLRWLQRQRMRGSDRRSPARVEVSKSKPASTVTSSPDDQGTPRPPRVEAPTRGALPSTWWSRRALRSRSWGKSGSRSAERGAGDFKTRSISSCGPEDAAGAPGETIEGPAGVLPGSIPQGAVEEGRSK